MEELYNLLKEDGSYTGSYEQFVKDYGLNDDDYKELHGLLVKDGSYTGDFNKFKVDYVPGKQTPTAPGAVVEETVAPVETATALPLADGSLASVPEFDYNENNIIGYEKVSDPNDPTVLEKYEQKEKAARYAGRIAREKNKYDEIYGIKDKDGNFILDDFGNVKRRDLSSLEKINNSIIGISDRIKKFDDQIDITTGVLFEQLLPDELLEDYDKNGENSLLARIPTPINPFSLGLIGSKTDIEDAQKEKATIDAISQERGGTGEITKGFKEGDAGEIASGIVNGLTSFVPSLVLGTLTFGTSTATEFFGDAYTDYNSEVAKRKGITFKELRDKNEDSFAIPLAVSGINTALEQFGFGQVGKALINKAGAAGAKRVANIFLAGGAEGTTEYFQNAVETAQSDYGKNNNVASATNALVDSLTSQQGLESFLQGFVGGSGVSGVGSNAENIKSFVKTAANLRAPSDVKGIEKDIDELAKLETKLKRARTQTSKEGIQQKIDEVNSRLTTRITKSNSIIPKLTKNEIDEVNNMGDLAELQVERVKKLNEELAEGKIKRSDYLVALEGYKATYVDAKNRIKGIADSVKTRPETKVAEEIETTEAELTPEQTAINKIITKEKVASNKVQEIYDEKGVEGAAEIINLFKPITNKIVQKRRDAPNFDKELLESEIEIGERGILDLIRSYNPESGVPLAAYINKFLPARAIESSRRILGEQFTEDVTEAKGVTATEVTDEIVTEPLSKDTKQARKTLAEDLELNEEIVEDVKKSVRKTFGTKLPAVTDKKFKRALLKNFRDDLTKTFKNTLGTGLAYKQYLENNFENIFKAIPQETLNKKFSGLFTKEVTDKTGKQLREKTQVGKKVFERPDITVEQFVDYFTGPDVYANLANSRKTSLAQLLADEIGLDEVVEALKETEVTEKFKAVQELQGQKVPENFIQIISKQIDRAIDYIDKLQKNNNTLYVSLGFPELTLATVKGFLKGVKLALKAGDSLAKAINKGIKIAQKEFNTKESKQSVKDALKSIYKTEKDLQSKTKADQAIKEIDKATVKEKGTRVFNSEAEQLKKTNNPQQIVEFIKYILPTYTSANLIVGSNASQALNYLKKNNIIPKKFADKFTVKSGKIYFENKVIKTLVSKTNLKTINGNYKRNPKEFIKYLKDNLADIDTQADNNKKYILQKITKLLKENRLNDIGDLLQLMGNLDSASPMRLLGKIRSIQKGAKEITYEHTPPIKTLIEKVRGIVNNYKGNISETIKEIDNVLSDSYVDLIEKGSKIPNDGNTVQRYKNILDPNKDLEYFRKDPNKTKTLSEEFNKILEDKTGISADKVYSDAKASVAGRNKGRFKFFIPPSAEDFVGLLYATLSKKKLGDKQMEFYKRTLLDPYARAMSNIAKERIALTSAYKAIVKNLKVVPKNLRKEIPGEGFTREQAVRVYMWDKDGIAVPGISDEDLKMLVDTVENDKKLKEFADQILSIQPEGLASPTDAWLAGSLDSDLLATLNTTKRKKYLEEWQANVDAIFSEQNLNKLEAIYGKSYRVALENILKRMETGRNRSYGGDALTTRLTDWISNSVGAIMFFNTRSAVLQTISSVNFINWSDNNLLAAAGAFANQKQYWSDFLKLMNSDFLKDRRGGLKINVNETDIAQMAATSKNKVKGVISGLLKLGFLPTQIADSFAIASGGATFYRNRIKSLMKDGMSKNEAEQQAMQDFSETAEESQQSSRPDRISQQQAGPLGRIILAFANTPAQYARLTKKAILDLKNGRGDAKTNISKIIYYGVAQNIIFTALQQALFATLFDDEEEEKESDRYVRGANSMLDSFLRGIGFAGAAVSVGKNIALEILKQSEKKSPEYEDAALKLLDISPPISSKVSKLRSAGRIFSWNKKEIREKGLSFDNPANEAIGKIISATTNIPVDRAIQKADNIQNALAEDTDTWQRIALAAGWKDWELGMQEKKKKKAKGTRSRTRTRTRTRTRKRN